MCALLVGEGDEAVAATETGHGVHHETQVPDRAALLEQRDEFVLEHLSRDLSAVALAALQAENVRVAVNQSFLSAGELIQPGDEVAFMPPVTGG